MRLPLFAQRFEVGQQLRLLSEAAVVMKQLKEMCEEFTEDEETAFIAAVRGGGQPLDSLLRLCLISMWGQESRVCRRHILSCACTARRECALLALSPGILPAHRRGDRL